jgi:crotonobetainyl-CoA:carnitine CoA-transferase CaiB-like acyl-CoA transferase
MIDWLPVDADSTAPLAGLRVLDLSELLPGPFMTQSLVELGADVIKVERPPQGDPIRRAAPALFVAVNRGKRALCVDLKTEAGLATMLALADGADVMVESFRPGVIARLGLDWPRLQQRNPRLVLASLSGYGSTGPRALWPGHDLNYLAAAGVVGMAMKDEVTSPSFGVPVADLAGATYALAAVQTALLHRVRSGRGQHLDISLTHCVAHWMNPRLAALHDAGGEVNRARRAVQQRPAYGTFICRDGRALTVAALEDHFWQALVRALPLPAYADPAYARYPARAAAAADINAAIALELRRQDCQAALHGLASADVPVAEVVALDELATAPAHADCGMFVDTAAGPLLRFPVRLAGVSASLATLPAP